VFRREQACGRRETDVPAANKLVIDMKPMFLPGINLWSARNGCSCR